jgi:hypothetical protein
MWFNKMEIDVIRYTGGPNHITILYKNKDSKKLFVFYCYTGKPLVNIEEEVEFFNTKKESTIKYKAAEIIIPINTCKNGVWYQIEINKEEDFDLIERVVSSIMEDPK